MNCPKDKNCCWDCENGYVEYNNNGEASKFHCLYLNTQQKKEMTQKIGDLIIEAVRRPRPEYKGTYFDNVDYWIAEYLVDNGVILIENNTSGE